MNSHWHHQIMAQELCLWTTGAKAKLDMFTFAHFQHFILNLIHSTSTCISFRKFGVCNVGSNLDLNQFTVKKEQACIASSTSTGLFVLYNYTGTSTPCWYTYTRAIPFIDNILQAKKEEIKNLPFFFFLFVRGMFTINNFKYNLNNLNFRIWEICVYFLRIYQKFRHQTGRRKR